MVCSVEGEVRGYQPIGFEAKALGTMAAFSPGVNSPVSSPTPSSAFSPSVSEALSSQKSDQPNVLALKKQQKERHVQELLQTVNVSLAVLSLLITSSP